MFGFYKKKVPMLKQILVLAGILLILPGCVVVQIAAVKATSSVLGEASAEIETETDWELFKNGLPGDLKLMEALLYEDPENSTLLSTLAKGYAGYAYGFYETMHLKEKYSEADLTPYRTQASAAYARAIKYGFRYLTGRGVDVGALSAGNKKISAILDAQLSTSNKYDIEAVFYTGQSWMSLINLNRDQPKLLGQMPRVKGLFDWVCKAKPDYQHGACDIFYGAWESSRPRALGGNPKKGKAIFLKAIKKYPHNLMIRSYFVEQYIIPSFDETSWKEQKRYLTKALRAQKTKVYIPGQEKVNVKGVMPNAQLFSAIALKRFQTVLRYEKDIF